MLARLRIGPKLLLAPGVVLVLLVLLSCGAYVAMVRQNASLDIVVQQRAAHLRAASDLVASAQRANAQAYQILTWISGSFPRARVDPLVRDVQMQQAGVERGFASLARMARETPARHREVELRYVEQAASAWRLYMAAVRDVIELAQEDQSISANAMAKAERAFGVVAERVTELARREQAMSEEASDEAESDFKIVATLMPIVIVLSIAGSLAITMAVRRSLLGEIGAIEAAASSLASGDLTVRARLDGDDEIATTSRALDDSIRNLNLSLRTILESARSIGSASREIALGRAGLPARAGVRASLEQTATSMQDLATTMMETADSARQANRLAESATAAAQQGGSVVHRLVATLESVRRTATRMDELGESIEDACSRAGSLALGAAVEAAQGGPRAWRFAQTASEVRALAGSAVAGAREARALAREAMAAIEGGTGIALDAGSSMADLASSVQEVGDIVNRIGCASAARAENLVGVNLAIVRMDELNQQGTRMVEDAAMAARTLQQQALSLSQAVAAFRLDEVVQAPSDSGNENGAAGAPDKR
ncbi:methyl-accepting chemotaxis protein, partial [Massilia sp. LXY-6]|uniref:methyl-accepting chemotaxis protein n=1 Tax=Massilia sp. LXY-6 TaxID=3379823 RepID=UPI003EE40162